MQQPDIQWGLISEGEAVWGSDGGDKTMLKQLVYRLRAKLEEVGTAVQIETIPGVGYSLRQE